MTTEFLLRVDPKVTSGQGFGGLQTNRQNKKPSI